MIAATQGLARSDIGAVPGWYGKLPSLGDFASRRLEGDFIEPWDLWLGERLQALRDGRGEAWLAAYLHSPPWRFLLPPGFLPGFDRRAALAGVLLPSVDRVGRYFPLTLVAALPRLPTSAHELDALFAWLQHLEDAALDAVQHEWGIEALESALAGLAPPGSESLEPVEDPLASARRELAAAFASRGGSVELAPAAGRREVAALIAGAMDSGAVPFAPTASGRRPDIHGLGLWLADRPERQRLVVSDGLPGVGDFFLMFGAAAAHVAPAAAPIPDDADLLGMFDIAPAATAALSPAPAVQPLVTARDADVLGLFGASPAAAKDETDAETRPVDHDILGLFAAPAAGAAPEADADKSPAPDILDLFGATPSDPGTAGSGLSTGDDGGRQASADSERHRGARAEPAK